MRSPEMGIGLPEQKPKTSTTAESEWKEWNKMTEDEKNEWVEKQRKLAEESEWKEWNKMTEDEKNEWVEKQRKQLTSQ